MLWDDVIIRDPIEAHSKLIYTNSPCLSGAKLSQWVLPGEL